MGGLTFFGFLIFCAYWILKRKYEYWKKCGVSHPNPSLFFGNLGKVLCLKETFGNLCNDIYKKYPSNSIVGFYYISTPAIVVRDVKLIKEMMIKEFHKFEDHLLTVDKNVDPILSANLICQKGSEWKQARTQLTPQFTISKLKMIIPVLQKVGQDVLLYIQQQIALNKSTCFGVQELSHRFTGEAVFMSAFGLEGKSFSDATPIAFKIGEEIAGTGLKIKIKHLVGLLFPSLAKYFKTTFIGSPVTARFQNIIVDTIKYRRSHSQNRNDYIDYISKLRNKNNTELQDQEIAGHAFTYYLNGFETSAVTLTYLLYELALNQDVQEKCRKEIKRALKNDSTDEAVAKLKYTESAIYETLRKHSPITVSLRSCTADYTIPQFFGNGDEPNLTIKKNTKIVFPIESIHRDPLYYPNPDVFDPERFTETNATKLPFFGFGDGPRTCLGKNFALLQIKVFVTAVLSEYKLTLNRKTVTPYEQEFLQILNIPKDEIYIDFEKISKNENV